MTQPDPWELARSLLQALDAVTSTWKVDPAAPGAFRRVPISAMKAAEAAVSKAPRYLARVRSVGGQQVYSATPEEVEGLRRSAEAVLARAVPGGGAQVTVHADDLEAMRRALNVLAAVDRDVGAA